MDSVWLSDYTWQEVEDYLKTRRTIIVPVGATEQHGPAGPLGVDTLVAMGLAEDAARETQSLVAPPLWVSDSFHHRQGVALHEWSGHVEWDNHASYNCSGRLQSHSTCPDMCGGARP